MAFPMRLFFDTETTGLPRDHRAPVSRLDNWPRLVQLAWLLQDDHGNEIASAEHIVRPDGFTIPPDAARVHGITTERALEEGVEIAWVLQELTDQLERSTVLVAHNVSFDEKVVGAELLRAGYRNLIAEKQRLCTMRSSTHHCRLPGPYGYKWPTLAELHKHLFGHAFKDAHRALADVRACARCYAELRRLGVMT